MKLGTNRKKSIITLSFLSFICVVIVLFCTGRLSFLKDIPTIYHHLLGASRTQYSYKEFSAEEEREKSLKYLNNLKQPVIRPDEIVKRLKRDPYIMSPEMKDTVCWYVFHGDVAVIAQLINNLDKEVKAILSLDQNSSDYINFKPYDPNNQDYIDPTDMLKFVEGKEIPVNPPRSGFRQQVSYSSRGNYYGLLSAYYGTSDGVIMSMLREELCRQSLSAERPHLVYLLFSTIEEKQRLGCTEGAKDTAQDDIKAYLLLYSKYTRWPSIRNGVYYHLNHLAPQWHSHALVDRVLFIVDNNGFDDGYKYYMQQVGNKN